MHDLKINEFYVNGLGEAAVDDAPVRLIANFAQTPDLGVTTEEVESDWQAASLTAVGCALTRGFYFLEPFTGKPAGRSWRRILCGGHLS